MVDRRVWGVFAGVAVAAGGVAPARSAHAQTPYMVKDIKPGRESGGPGALHDANGTLLFNANDLPNTGNDAGEDIFNVQPWRSDGTEAGTTLLKAVSPFGEAYVSAFVNVGGKVYFDAASSGPTFLKGCRELWTTDGSTAGTVLAASACPGISFFLDPVAVIGGQMYFVGEDFPNSTSPTGNELWTSDGTQAGTRVVRNDIGVGTGGVAAMAVLDNGLLVFSAAMRTADLPWVSGYLPWVSDGSPGGTMLLRMLNPGSSSGNVAGLRAAGGLAYFYDHDSRGVWRTDGTTLGTLQVGTWGPTPGYGGDIPGILGSAAFFNGPIPSTSDLGTVDLWRTDGTTAGTAVLKTFDAHYPPLSMPAGFLPAPREYAAVGNTLYFLAATAAEGAELWKTDGTTAGTVLVKDIQPGAGSSSPNHLTGVRGMLYFGANDGVHGCEVWRSDGTEAGTVMLGDVAPGTATGFDQGLTGAQFVASGTRVFFQADDGVHGLELWAVDLDASTADAGATGDAGLGADGSSGGAGGGAAGGAGGGLGGAAPDGGAASAGRGGSTPAGGAAGASNGGSGPTGSGGRPGGDMTATSQGCGCVIAASRDDFWLVVLALLAALTRRRGFGRT